MATLEKAIEWMESGNVDEAMSLLHRLLIHASDDDKFTIAYFYYEWGYFDEAAPILEELLEKYPNEGQIIVQLTAIYIELEKDDQAIQLLNGVDKEDDYYLESLLHLADLYQAQGLFEVAEQKLLEAKQLAPEELVIDFALGEFLFSIGQANRAIPFFERVLEQQEELNAVSIRERLAECHATIGHYEAALQYYEKIDTKNPDTLFKHGFTAYQQKRDDIAIPIWKRLLDLDPYYHTVYYELAEAMKREGLINDAYEIVQQGLDYDEYNKELFFIAAQLAIQLQDDRKAQDYLNKAIALDQDYKEAIMLLVELYKQSDDNEAIIELLTGLQGAAANDPLYDWALANAYIEQEAYKEARAAYKEASNALSHDSDFLKEYGYFLIEEGLRKEAQQIFSAYLQLEPLDAEIEAFIERLNDSNIE